MRILTVRQPWALHIIQSGKDVENRIRNIAGGYRGPVAIHAALAMDDEAMRRLPIHAPNGIPRSFWTGVIIGTVEIVGVHASSVLSCHREDHRAGICSEWAIGGQYHLELADPRPLWRPIPYKGALGLRTLPEDVVELVERTTR